MILVYWDGRVELGAIGIDIASSTRIAVASVSALLCRKNGNAGVDIEELQIFMTFADARGHTLHGAARCIEINRESTTLQDWTPIRWKNIASVICPLQLAQA